MATKKKHLVGAYGLFWKRDLVDWNPGPGKPWQMLASAFHADLGDTTLRNVKVPVLLGKLGLARVQDDQEGEHFAGEA